MKQRYVGIYNYEKNSLPMTKMVAFEQSLEAAVTVVREHANDNNHSSADYHIAIYECEEWGDQNTEDLPVKIGVHTL